MKPKIDLNGEYARGVRAKVAAVSETGQWNLSPSIRDTEDNGTQWQRGWHDANKMSDAALEAHGATDNPE